MGYGFVRYWRNVLNKIDFLAINMSVFFLIYQGGSECGSIKEGYECMDDTLVAIASNNISTTDLSNIEGSSLSNFVTIFHDPNIATHESTICQSGTARCKGTCTAVHSIFWGSFLLLLRLCCIGNGTVRRYHALYSSFSGQSSYGLSQYYMNRFDNVYLAFMTLFELMVVNNWNVIMEGYVAATERSGRDCISCYGS